METTIYKKIIGVILIIVIGLISIFVISPIAKSNKFHSNIIKSLDDKKVTVTELTVACAGTSMALAAIPGDTSTPVANKIMDLSSYLLIIVGVIFLEKILLTLTGYVTFTFIIPISCALLITYFFSKNDILKKLAIKLSVFGIVIFITIPLSVQMSNIIENSYKETLESVKNEKVILEEQVTEETKDEGLLSKMKDGIENIGDGASKLIEKGKQTLSNFIDAIAILLITSCVIPIVVLIFLVWVVKMIFGIKISMPSHNKLKKEKMVNKIDTLIDNEN